MKSHPQYAIIRALIHSLTNGVALFDNNKQAVVANPAMVRMTGLPEEGFYLSELAMLFEHAQVNLEIKLQEAISSGKTLHVEEVEIADVFYEIFIVPVQDDNEKIFGGAIIIYDITHLKELGKMKDEFLDSSPLCLLCL